MYRNKNYNIEEALTYILDGESDFEDLNDSDSDFEPEDVTVNEVDVDFVASNPDELVQHQNVSVDLEDQESFDQECSDFSDNDNEPLANMVKNKNKPVTVKRLWKKVDLNDVGDTTFHDLPPQPEPDDKTTPYQYFKMFVTDELLDMVKEQTNLYSAQSTGSSINVTAKDIEKFIGAYFRMGLVRMPSVRSYWETYMSYDGVNSALSRNRFWSILRNLHFVDNLNVTQETKDSDRVWKVRPWISGLRDNFLKVSPEEFHSVDEIMIAFKGRSLLRQYLPNKPNKWGFKLWGRSGYSGFLYDFDVYQGKETKSSRTSTYGVGASVVINMTSSLPSGHNFKVFADNFFTSLPLLDVLKERAIWFAGTIRINRMNNCPLLCEKDLRKGGRGSYDYRTHTHSKSIAVRWYDNTAVTLVSSYIGIEPVHSVKRYDRKEKKHVQVEQPHVIQTYNKYMGGIDKLDMMCSFYKANLKCHRWYIYIWAHTTTIALVNAWFLYRRNLKLIQPNAKHMPLKKFQAEVASSLIQAEKRKIGRPSLDQLIVPPPKKVAAVQSNPTQDVRRDKVNHMPAYTEKRQRCKQCKIGFSYIQCQKCNVWLCLQRERNCFNDFHT